MELAFATSDLEATAYSESRLRKIFGDSARRACQRLCELSALETLAVADTLPTLDLKRSANANRFSVWVSQDHRILFEPVLTPRAGPPLSDPDLVTVTKIRILALGGKNDA